MKISVEELRAIVREEYLRGVPEFELTEATHKYVESIKARVRKHIEQTYRNPVDAREKYDTLNEVFKELEEDVNELLEEKIWTFLQRT